MFCGSYVTPVPEGYFEHLAELRGKKKKAPVNSATVASSGHTAAPHHSELTIQDAETARAGLTSPMREDISLHNVASDADRR